MLKIIKLSIILLLIFNIFSIGAITASADTLPPVVPGAPTSANAKGDEKYQTGDYQLNDMVKIAVNISQIILGLVGSLSLLAFVAGGVMWLVSAGNPEWVTRGKQTIIGAVIGLTIVFTSYMIIFFVYKSLGITEPISGSSWFTSDWFSKKTPR